MVVLSDKNSIANNFIAELRDKGIQKDAMRFRKNMERIGEVMAYEISMDFSYKPVEIQTPLGTSVVNLPESQPVLTTILRAGLPFYQGFLNFFDKAENAFIGSYRKPNGDGSFEIKTDYVSTPKIEGKILIIADPMLATGRSLIEACTYLTKLGKPKAIYIASIIASAEGIKNIEENLPEVKIYTAAIDKVLNEKKYIIPGLGDAGDLAFGERDL